MKNTLIVILLMISLTTLAQKEKVPIYYQTKETRQWQLQSLMKQNLQLSDSARLEMIQLNLYRFSRTYEVGTVLIIFGIAISTLGYVLNNNSGNPDAPYIQAGAGIAGGVLVTSGWIVQQVAHKHIRKASGIK